MNEMSQYLTISINHIYVIMKLYRVSTCFNIQNKLPDGLKITMTVRLLNMKYIFCHIYSTVSLNNIIIQLNVIFNH